VLAPGGTYLAQHVGSASAIELSEYFLGPVHSDSRGQQEAQAQDAGLDVVDLRSVRLRMEFHDIGAVVYFLRKVIWIVPGFTVDTYLPKLRDLHDKITADGPFVAHSSRVLIEARKP
jgi:hypothetical protein